MKATTSRREALEVLPQRGLSQRKACCYLGLSRRVATYALKQPQKDRSVGERLIAAAQEVPHLGYRRISAWLALGKPRVRRMWRALQLNIGQRRRRCGCPIIQGRPDSRNEGQTMFPRTVYASKISSLPTLSMLRQRMTWPVWNIRCSR